MRQVDVTVAHLFSLCRALQNSEARTPYIQNLPDHQASQPLGSFGEPVFVSFSDSREEFCVLTKNDADSTFLSYSPTQQLLGSACDLPPSQTSVPTVQHLSTTAVLPGLLEAWRDCLCNPWLCSKSQHHTRQQMDLAQQFGLTNLSTLHVPDFVFQTRACGMRTRQRRSYAHRRHCRALRTPQLSPARRHERCSSSLRHEGLLIDVLGGR